MQADFDYTCMFLAAVLKHKAKHNTLQAKIPLPQPPYNQKGDIIFGAWAKLLRNNKHPWYYTAQNILTNLQKK